MFDADELETIADARHRARPRSSSPTRSTSTSSSPAPRTSRSPRCRAWPSARSPSPRAARRSTPPGGRSGGCAARPRSWPRPRTAKQFLTYVNGGAVPARHRHRPRPRRRLLRRARRRPHDQARPSRRRARRRRVHRVPSPRRRTSPPSTSARCSPTATAWRSAVARRSAAAWSPIPNEVFYARPEHGRHLVRFACCKRLDVLDEPPTARGLNRKAVVVTTLRVAAVQHDIVWNDRDANFARLAPMIAAAGGARVPSSCCVTETFSTGFAVDVPDLGEPEGGPSAQFLAAQAAEHGVWVGGTCPEIPPTRRPTTNARTTASCSPAPTARCTATARSTRSATAARRSTSGRQRADHGRHRRASGQPVGVLRPALRRRVLAARRGHRRLPRARQLARASGAALDSAAAGPGDREPGVRRRGQPGGRGRRAALQRATAASSTRVGELLATAARTETILLADISADHVCARSATTSGSSKTAALDFRSVRLECVGDRADSKRQNAVHDHSDGVTRRR